jgi:hypothetical protein
VIAFRKTTLVLAGLAFWTGEIMSLLATTPAVLGWGVCLISASLVVLLLITGGATTFAGVVAGALAVVLGAFLGGGFVAWAFAERWVAVPPLVAFLLLMRTAFWAIERAEVRRLIERRHG